jgi:methionyl-tRNA synthetase
VEGDSNLANEEAESALEEVGKKYDRAMSNFHFREALISVWELMAFCDQYIDQEEPWQEKKPNREKVINDLRLILGNIADFLEPFLPETVEKIRAQLQGHVGKSILFPRFK